MKFGQRILNEADPRFSDEYISYKQLKKAIKLITGSDVSTYTIQEVNESFGHIRALGGSIFRPTESRFQDLLDYELEKINTFSKKMELEIRNSLEGVLQRIRDNPIQAKSDPQIKQSLEFQAKEIIILEKYQRLNFIGFRKIIKKYDKNSKSAASSWFLSRLFQEYFMTLNFDFLLDTLSQCWSLVSIASSFSSAVPGESYQRYLVPLESIMEVKTLLCQNSRIAPLDNRSIPISSVYFDTRSFDYLNSIMSYEASSNAIGGIPEESPVETTPTGGKKRKGEKTGKGKKTGDVVTNSQGEKKKPKVYRVCWEGKNTGEENMRLDYQLIDYDENPSLLSQLPKEWSQSPMRQDYLSSGFSGADINYFIREGALEYSQLFSAARSERLCVASRYSAIRTFFSAGSSGKQIILDENIFLSSPPTSTENEVSLEDFPFFHPCYVSSSNLPEEAKASTPQTLAPPSKDLLAPNNGGSALNKSDNSVNTSNGYGRKKMGGNGNKSRGHSRQLSRNLSAVEWPYIKREDTDTMAENHYALGVAILDIPTSMVGILSSLIDGPAGVKKTALNRFALSILGSHLVEYCMKDKNRTNAFLMAFLKSPELPSWWSTQVSSYYMSSNFDIPMEGQKGIEYDQGSSDEEKAEKKVKKKEETWGKIDNQEGQKLKKKGSDQLVLSQKLDYDLSQTMSQFTRQHTGRVDIYDHSLNPTIRHEADIASQKLIDIRSNLQNKYRSTNDSMRYISGEPLMYANTSNSHHYRLLHTHTAPNGVASSTLGMSEEAPRREETGAGTKACNWLKACVGKIRQFVLFGNTEEMEHLKQLESISANVKIEPRTFFANERTLLSWLTVCVLLFTIAVSMLSTNFLLVRVGGYLFANVSLGLIISSFVTFVRRTRALINRTPIQYYDLSKTTILTFVLALYILIMIIYKDEMRSESDKIDILSYSADNIIKN